MKTTSQMIFTEDVLANEALWHEISFRSSWCLFSVSISISRRALAIPTPYFIYSGLALGLQADLEAHRKDSVRCCQLSLARV